jgi:hypothetical protein
MVVYGIFKKVYAYQDSLELVELKVWENKSAAILRKDYLAKTDKYSFVFLSVKAIEVNNG